MDLWINCITKRFPGIKVLEEVSAEISAGNIVALLGSNGAGKTTLLRCLATLSNPDSGDIRLDGEVLKRGRIDLRRRLMFLLDFPTLLNHADPLAVIAMHLKLWQADRPDVEQRVADLMDRLQIASLCDVPVYTFSRGQNYKTALAALAAVDPELWLLDEPFASGMDPQGIATFRHEGEQAVKERGRILIYSTQMVEQACSFSTRVAVISRGKLALYDTEKDLNRDPRKLDEMLISRRA
ncbi:MAG TPA: ABC transporter ATP-binding protein [Prosthecobacter sp.]